MTKTPRLFIVIPCYNEQEVLPITAPLFLNKILSLAEAGKIAADSRVLFVNDGSRDRTWEIIRTLAGQDDINAMDKMVDAYLDGCEVVYGVRSSRETDTFFKRFTAESFYKFLAMMGAEVVFNHADYRLISARVLKEFANFREVNLYLRGMVPLVGFKSTTVTYSRAERMAGESHYPLKKMIGLAVDGVTSLSVKPLSMIFGLGFVIALVSFLFCIWALITALCGKSVPGWASMTCIICFVSGVQILCLGVIAEYIGKIYMETKQRPRYIISERTWEEKEE